MWRVLFTLDLSATEVKDALRQADGDIALAVSICASKRRSSVQRLLRREPTASVRRVAEVSSGAVLVVNMPDFLSCQKYLKQNWLWLASAVSDQPGSLFFDATQL